MLLLLGILKRNKYYFMNIVDTDNESKKYNYQLIDPDILDSCDNVSVQNYLSSKQNPKEYLKGEFDVTDLIVDNNKLKARLDDYQIVSIYYDDNNKPCLYRSVNRAGDISMHDISEFDYTKKNSILGDDINNLPSFVEKKKVEDAYLYLNNNRLDESKIGEMPVGLAKHYLIGVKGFKEGYHTVTKTIYGVPISIHEYMLFNGTASLKLIEYVTEDKDVFLTKQDYFSNPYPKERTVDYAPSPIILLGSKQIISSFFKLGVKTEFTFYNNKITKLIIPFDEDTFTMFDKYKKSKATYNIWKLDSNNNITFDIYEHILPNEIFKLPSSFCRDMKNLPFSVNKSYKLEEENDNVKRWIYTVALFICWPFYTNDFKKRIRAIIKNYKMIYTSALNNLVRDIGPKNTLFVMKWTQEHLKEVMKNILDTDISFVDENSCLFTFYQNKFDLPEVLRVYSEDTILSYGGVDKLKEDFETKNSEYKTFIIMTLEKIESELRDSIDLEIDSNIKSSLRRINRNVLKNL